MKTIKSLIYYYLRIIGLKNNHASLYANVIYNDWRKTPISLQKKIWAYRRGFLSSRIELYGLNDLNYKDYLSDKDY